MVAKIVGHSQQREHYTSTAITQQGTAVKLHNRQRASQQGDNREGIGHERQRASQKGDSREGIWH